MGRGDVHCHLTCPSRGGSSIDGQWLGCSIIVVLCRNGFAPSSGRNIANEGSPRNRIAFEDFPIKNVPSNVRKSSTFRTLCH